MRPAWIDAGISNAYSRATTVTIFEPAGATKAARCRVAAVESFLGAPGMMTSEQESFPIREARPADLRALAQLHVETFKETHGRRGAPSYALREKQWRAAFERNGDWFTYVVEGPHGELVGFAKGTLHDGGVEGFEGELNKIYVLRRRHRHGIGRRLVEQVARRFLEQGINSMLLFGDARSPSNGFYEHLGAERLLSREGEFHGGYGWRDLHRLVGQRATHQLSCMTDRQRPVTGRVERLWVKRAHRGPMDAVDTIDLVAGRGVAGSADQGGRRQVTLLEREVWERLMRELGSTAGPETRRANVLVSGIALQDSRGRVIRVGTTTLRVLGEVKPCAFMEAAVPGLRAAMYPDWQGGAFAEVLEGGEVSVGDAVEWVEP